MATNPENPVRINYSHTSVPHHVDDLRKQAENPQAPRGESGEKGLPMQGVIFDSRDIDLFNQALQDPNHKHRREAVKAMRGFTRSLEKPKGMSISSASREFNVPLNFLWRWSKQRHVITIVSEGIGSGSATYEEKYPESSKLPQK
jgi:hypothetical protein